LAEWQRMLMRPRPETRRKARQVMAMRVLWWAKNRDEKKAAFRELRVSRVGRRARLLGTVETVAANPPPRAELPSRGHSGLKEDQYKSAQGVPRPRHSRKGKAVRRLECREGGHAAKLCRGAL